jgi:2-dehydropantoate 2-reductase
MQNNETIYIIGAGAIGKALAVFLKHEGRNVVLIRGSIDDASSSLEKIKVELHDDHTGLEAELPVSTLSNFSALNGIVVFTNKSYGNQQLSEAVKNKINDSPIVILQNGLNVEKPFLDNCFSRVYRCVLFASSQSLSKNTIKFRPIATSFVGIIKGDMQSLGTIVQLLNNQYFKFCVEENIQPVIWTKAIVNSVFNSICPLIEADNGIFLRNKKVLDMGKSIIDECIYIAETKGVFLDKEKVIESMLMISERSSGQFISTYQDIENRRRTEIETLNLAFVDMATELNTVDLVPMTKLLGELIYMKSGLSMHQ